jgi:hypothetical protein
MIRDFSERAQAFHSRQFEEELEKLGVEAGLEREVNLALQNLRNKGVMDLERSRQAYDRPEQGLRILTGEQGLRQQRFDLSMGQRFVPSLLRQRVQQGALETDYLRDYLATGPLAGGATRGQVPTSPITGRTPVGTRQTIYGRVPLYGESPRIDPRELSMIMRPHFPGPFLGTEKKRRIPRATELLEMMEVGP